MDRDFAALLEQSPLLSGLDPFSRTALGMHFRPARFAPGEHLIRHGQPPERVLLLLQGQAEVRVPDAPGQEGHLVTTLGGDHLLGEVAFFGHETPASADVIAQGEVVAAELSRDTYDGMVQSDPGAAETFEKIVLGVMMDRVDDTNARVVALVRDHADDPSFRAAARMLARKL